MKLESVVNGLLACAVVLGILALMAFSLISLPKPAQAPAHPAPQSQQSAP